jgi:bla regulator protein blaR1
MYAEALLRIACIPAKCFAMNATGNKNDLLSRVKRMLNQQEKSYSYRNQVFALMLITIMLCCAAWFNPPGKYKVTANKTSETHNIVIEPLSASADNPLFSPIYFLSKPIQQELNKAINTANDKVEETAHVVAKTASNILTKVAPIALEKLKIDIDTEVNAALAQAQNAHKAIDQLKAAPSLVIDTTNLVSAVKDVVLNEINKTDWKQIGTDIQKAQANILTRSKDKSLSLVNSKQIADALKNTMLQLEGLNGNNFTFLKNSLQGINDKTKQKIERSKKPQEKIKAEEQKCRTLNTYSDIQDDNVVLDQNMQNYFSQASQNSEIYTPLQFNNLNYTYSVSDSVNKQPQSAIIIVKHNPENDSSHVKNITVEIIGDNGEKKTYEFTVEVYQ